MYKHLLADREACRESPHLILQSAPVCTSPRLRGQGEVHSASSVLCIVLRGSQDFSWLCQRLSGFDRPLQSFERARGNSGCTCRVRVYWRNVASDAMGVTHSGLLTGNFLATMTHIGVGRAAGKQLIKCVARAEVQWCSNINSMRWRAPWKSGNGKSC